MKLSELLKNTDGIVYGKDDPQILSITQDSRKVDVSTLFIAIQGLQQNGHDFISSAIEKGAVAIVVEDLPNHLEGLVDEGIVVVHTQNSRRLLAILARHLYRKPDEQLQMIGVTGTNGKTSMTYILDALLRADHKSCGVIGTVSIRYNGKEIKASGTTPESIDLMAHFEDMVKDGVSHVAMEVSSHALVLNRVEGIQYEVGIFTNLTQDHLDFHDTMDAYFRAKRQLFKQVKGLSLINIDDMYGQSLYQELKENGQKVLSYGFSVACDLRIQKFEMDYKGSSFELRFGDETKTYEIGMPGRFNAYNFTAAIAASRYLGVPEEVFQHTLKTVRVPGRVEAVENLLGAPLFVDYAHTPDALEKVLKTMKEFTPKRVICIFGCGGDRDKGKRPLMGAIAEKEADLVIVTSDNPRTEEPLTIVQDILKGMIHSDRSNVILSREEAIKLGLELWEEGDAILIAGKGHEDYQIIGTNKIPFDDRIIAKEMAEFIYDQRKS